MRVYNPSRPKFYSVEDAATAAFLFSFLNLHVPRTPFEDAEGPKVLTLWWCHRFSNLFSQKLTQTQPAPPFKVQRYTRMARFSGVPVVQLSLPAQYMGFRQLSESNNRLRQSGGTGRVCLCVFNQPPGCSSFFFPLLETSGKIQHLIVEGDLKFQSAWIEKQL